MTITFAHRGARIEEPENTLAAFRRGLELGASGVETDARLSLEGEVVLAHGPTCGRGRRRLSVDEASAADLASMGTPSLADVYAELGTDFELSIDLKVAGVGEAVLACAAAAGRAAGSRLWLCSPDLEVLRGLRRSAEPAGAHLVHSVDRRAPAMSGERHAADLAAGGIEVVNLHRTAWSAGLVALYHRFGVQAFAWDAQEERHLRALLAIDVDALYCDRPERMIAAIEAWLTAQVPATEVASEEAEPRERPYPHERPTDDS